MDCAIIWNTYTRTEWDALLWKCNHVPLLQSYYYAQAIRQTKQQSCRHGLIKINGKDAGIVQMQEVRLFGQAIHFLSIDRGPCWFNNFGNDTHLIAFAEELNRQFPARLGRKRRIMFEHYSKNRLVSFGKITKNQNIEQYKTFLLDISPDLSIIRNNFNKKWRNILNKSEKSDLSVKIDENMVSLTSILKNYAVDRYQKRYAGASAKLLATLCKFSAIHGQCFIMHAIKGDEIMASILVFTHGRGATYQIGWTNQYGRDNGAHHLLLWEAIKALKDRGITEFDLGGFNDDTDGIKKFKQGLGGQEIALIGSYN